MEGRSYIFFKSFEGVEENSKFYGEMYFWDFGVGKEKNRERIGFLGYVWEGMIYTIYSNESELQKCNSAFLKGVGVSTHC